MTRYVPVTRDQHGQRYWRRYDNYSFAGTIHLVEIAMAETARVAPAMPIAFVAAGEGFTAVAVMATEPNANVFVSPDSRWLGTYVPALLRGYPFRFLKAADERLVLCVDEAMVVDEPGEPFFDAEGEASTPVKGVVEFLQQIELSRAAACRAAGELGRLGLLKPLPAEAAPGIAPEAIAGVLSVDEAALDALSDADFNGLRAVGALRMAYHQLLSVGQWPALHALAQRHRQHRDEISARAAAIYRPADDGDLQIDWSQFKV